MAVAADDIRDSEAIAAPAVRVGRHLVEQEKLREADLARADRLAEENGDSLVQLLVRLGLVSEKDAAEAFSHVLSIPLAEAGAYPAEPILADILSERFLRASRILPLQDDGGRVVLAMVDPGDGYVRDAVALATARQVEPRVALPSDVDAALDRLYGGEEETAESAEDGSAIQEEDVAHLRDMASEAPIIRLVNLIIQRASERRASDIHIEPFEDQLKVRYRIDGVLQEVEAPPARSTAAVISRIKIMARLDIAERRLPQDGRIQTRVQGKGLDLRISTVPTVYGESVVIRLLDREAVTFDVDSLGFSDVNRDRFFHCLDMPYGIILVTGPTGSGKSTTLYTALHRLNTPDRKIITVEDPVEYQLTGVNQIHVKPQIGLDFASALRSIVRQDPDIIMVGEMRDLETARIAVQSALTGHLVLSTLHTNDAAGSVTRLLDMGVEDYLLTSTVNGIVAQRLVRRLCPACAEPRQTEPELIEELGLRRYLADGEEPHLYRAVGCDRCGGTGYRGRTVISEILSMDETLKRLVLKHASAAEIQQAAIAGGMRTMYEDGIRKCLAGETTVEEVGRVTEDAD